MTSGGLSQEHPLIQGTPGCHGDEDEIDDGEAKDYCAREFDLEKQGKEPVSGQEGEKLAQGKAKLRKEPGLRDEIQKSEGDLHDQLPQRGLEAGGYTQGKDGQPEIQVLAIDEGEAHSCRSGGNSWGIVS